MESTREHPVPCLECRRPTWADNALCDIHGSAPPTPTRPDPGIPERRDCHPDLFAPSDPYIEVSKDGRIMWAARVHLGYSTLPTVWAMSEKRALRKAQRRFKAHVRRSNWPTHRYPLPPHEDWATTADFEAAKDVPRPSRPNSPRPSERGGRSPMFP